MIKEHLEKSLSQLSSLEKRSVYTDEQLRQLENLRVTIMIIIGSICIFLAGMTLIFLSETPEDDLPTFLAPFDTPPLSFAGVILERRFFEDPRIQEQVNAAIELGVIDEARIIDDLIRNGLVSTGIVRVSSPHPNIFIDKDVFAIRVTNDNNGATQYALLETPIPSSPTEPYNSYLFDDTDSIPMSSEKLLRFFESLSYTPSIEEYEYAVRYGQNVYGDRDAAFPSPEHAYSLASDSFHVKSVIESESVIGDVNVTMIITSKLRDPDYNPDIVVQASKQVHQGDLESFTINVASFSFSSEQITEVRLINSSNERRPLTLRINFIDENNTPQTFWMDLTEENSALPDWLAAKNDLQPTIDELQLAISNNQTLLTQIEQVVQTNIITSPFPKGGRPS